MVVGHPHRPPATRDAGVAGGGDLVRWSGDAR
jgi:hypothetical protein